MLPPREFKTLRPDLGYPASLETLGDHLRSVRLDRGELQKDVATFIGVGVETTLHWELNQTEVTVRHYPMVMEYLRYCPIAETTGIPTLGEVVRLHRIHRGPTLREAAMAIGVDPGALSKWEIGAAKPLAKSAAKLTRFLAC